MSAYIFNDLCLAFELVIEQAIGLMHKLDLGRFCHHSGDFVQRWYDDFHKYTFLLNTRV